MTSPTNETAAQSQPKPMKLFTCPECQQPVEGARQGQLAGCSAIAVHLRPGANARCAGSYSLIPKEAAPVAEPKRTVANLEEHDAEGWRAAAVKSAEEKWKAQTQLAETARQRDGLCCWLELAARGSLKPEDMPAVNAAILAAGGRPCA